MVTTITKFIADLYHHGLMCMFVQSKKGVGVRVFVSVCRKSKRVEEEREPFSISGSRVKIY